MLALPKYSILTKKSKIFEQNFTINSMKRLFQLIFFLLLFITQSSWAQTPPVDTAANNKVDVDYADLFEYMQIKEQILQKLNGNVELRQDSVFMYCDTAVIIDNVNVIANGSVLIQQGDSLSVFSDSLEYDGVEKKATLFKNVILINGDQKLFTDRLDYDLKTKVATYFSGATLTSDSTQLTSRRGYYYVDEKEAFFKDSVVVVDSSFSLRSDTLKFNTETKEVFFLGPTLISGDSSRIYCEDGFYNTRSNTAEFRQNAQFEKGTQKAEADIIAFDGQTSEYLLMGDAVFWEEEEDRRATADTIVYQEKVDKTILSGNAIYQDATQNIASDKIVYDAKNEVYSTRGRSIISDPPQLLEADQVDYSQEDGLGIAMGNVIWQDTSTNLTIQCAKADYNRETDYLKASGGENGRPLLITILDGDSLFLTSDTLFSSRANELVLDSVRVDSFRFDTVFVDNAFRIDTLQIDTFRLDTLRIDTSRSLFAYYDVRIFKSNLQAICDSLIYNTTDSLFHFFDNPIIWSDTSQFVADTINMVLKENQIDKIYLIDKAFIINSPDELFFNQIKGKFIKATFRESNLRQMDVEGNAESVYYARDELESYVGVNKTICSEMILFFGDNQIDQIKFFAEPQAKLHPMTQVDHESLKLEQFFWEKLRRPKGIEDLFD